MRFCLYTVPMFLLAVMSWVWRAWHYFGRAPERLSWAETCTLAVLPNSPVLIHSGRNRARLKAMRDTLLKRLLKAEILGMQGLQFALREPLPQKLLALLKLAP